MRLCVVVVGGPLKRVPHAAHSFKLETAVQLWRCSRS